MPILSTITTFLEPSLICDLTRKANATGAVNLAEGLPDYPPPLWVQDSLTKALKDLPSFHQSENTWGYEPLRDAVSRYSERFHGVTANPENEITITCGATEGIFLTLQAILNTDDEIIVFDPFYEPYVPTILSLGAVPRYCTLNGPEWRIHRAALESCITPKTKAILLNNPCNPTGRVYSREELDSVAAVATKHDLWVLADEVYDQMVYKDSPYPFIAMRSLDGMRERTVSFGSCSKLLSATGWRVGWTIAPPALTDAIRALHDLSTAGTNTLFQVAAAHAIDHIQESDLHSMRDELLIKRKQAKEILLHFGGEPSVLDAYTPQAGYFYWVNIQEAFNASQSLAFADEILARYGALVVPGVCFQASIDRTVQTRRGENPHVRLCFGKQHQTLHSVLAQ